MDNRKILIRFDDICTTMDKEQFEKAYDILNKYNIKPVLGIIPDCKDPELQLNLPNERFWELMRDLQIRGYSLAMHGYKHVFDSNKRGMVNNGFQSEFAGHPYEIQCEKIKLGKEILISHGIKTDIFFAPAHSYDMNTLKALSKNGFKYLLDGMSLKLLKRENITCIPCHSMGCPKIKNTGYYVAVFHPHEWIRKDKAYGYKQLENLCEQFYEDIVDFNEFINREEGNFFVQIIEEKIYINYRRHIRPILSKCKQRIIN